MTTSIKVLGKVKSVGGSGVVLYTAPALTRAQGDLNVCNQDVATTVRVAILSAGITTPNVADYVFFDVSLGAGAAIAKSFCLGPDEKLWVRSASGEVSFVAMGMEIS
jgi:hypothetical protein